MQIQTMQDYIKVDIEEGLNYYEIAGAIQQLHNIPGAFRYLMVRIQTEQCELSHMQFRSIISNAKKNSPNNLVLEKTALVVNTGLQSGIARLFVEGVKGAACSFDVFRSQETALSWLLQPSARQLVNR